MVWQPRKNLVRCWKGAVEPSTVVSDVNVYNQIWRSNQFDTNWLNQFTVDSQDGTIDPYDGTDSWLITDDGLGGVGAVYMRQNVVHSGGTMILSMHVKPSSHRFAFMQIVGADNTGLIYFDLDVTTPVVGSISIAGGGVIKLTNDWYRIWGQFDTRADTTNDLRIGVANASNNHTMDRDGTSKIYMYGAQLESLYDGAQPSTYVDNPDSGVGANTRLITYGTPTVQTVTNACGYSHTLEEWFQQSNITVQDRRETAMGIPLALITDDATDGYHHVGQVNQYVADATRRRLSIYVKPGTARYVYFSDRAPSITNTQWSNIFDTQTGTWTFKGSLYVGLHEEEQFADGSWRISFVSAVLSGAYDNIYLGICNGPTKEDQSYIGSGDTMYAGGAQIEYDSDASPGPLVRHDQAGTSGASATDTFGWDQYGLWKGAVQPSTIPRLYGLENVELDLPVGLENQVFDIQLVGSTILKIDEFNSSQVIVDREFAVKTELWNSNTTIKVD